MKTAKIALATAAITAVRRSCVEEVAVPRMPRAIPTQAESTIIRAAWASEVLRTSIGSDFKGAADRFGGTPAGRGAHLDAPPGGPAGAVRRGRRRGAASGPA